MSASLTTDPLMRIVVLRSVAELKVIRDDWHDLLARCDRREVFQTHEWMSTWWEVYGGQDRQLYVLAIHLGRRLVGLAPFLIRAVRYLGVVRSRRLELIGTGEDEADEVCTDFTDIIAAPECVEQICRHVWQHLAANDDAWDEARFTNVLESSVLVRQLVPLARANGYATESAAMRERFYVDLSLGDFTTYVQRLSKKRRKRIFYYRRRIEKEGGLVEKEIKRRSDIPGFLTEIARLNLLRRGSQGKPSAFASGKFRRFHSLVVPRLWDAGTLDLRLWMHENRCVAALYNMVYAGVIYYYQSGFDTSAFGNTSPGLVTINRMIEWGFSQGHRRFDFLIGEAGSYKEDYGCQTESTTSIVLYSRSGAAWILRSATELRRLLSRGREAARRTLAGIRHRAFLYETVDDIAARSAPAVVG